MGGEKTCKLQGTPGGSRWEMDGSGGNGRRSEPEKEREREAETWRRTDVVGGKRETVKMEGEQPLPMNER